MYTEAWPREFTPVLPPRWNPATSPAAPVIYLDQWVFKHLVRDRAGSPVSPSDAGCYEYFRRLALAGQVVFVLSEAHYLETWRGKDPSTRWDMAVVMAELTGFNTISRAGLVRWDALAGVSAYLGLDTQLQTPNPFGWGYSHCLTGLERHAVVIDTSTGRPVGKEGLPDSAWREIAKLKIDERVELATLALRDPRLEPDVMTPLEPLPDDGAGSRLVREEADIVTKIEKLGRNLTNIRMVVEGLCFADKMTMRSVLAAEEALGLPPGTIVDQLSTASEASENRKELSRFLRCMPIQGRFAELRVHSHHQQKDRRRRPSDAGDYFVIASVSCLVDHMVIDRTMAHLAAAARITTRSGQPLQHRLVDLRQHLQDTLNLTA